MNPRQKAAEVIAQYIEGSLSGENLENVFPYSKDVPCSNIFHVLMNDSGDLRTGIFPNFNDLSPESQTVFLRSRDFLISDLPYRFPSINPSLFEWAKQFFSKLSFGLYKHQTWEYEKNVSWENWPFTPSQLSNEAHQQSV